MTIERDHLPRLDRGHYRGQAYAHWTLTIQDRRTRWLIPTFYYKFRELLTHTTFRYSLSCPIYCLMPDHMHLLWIGIADGSDQINAMRFFRKHVNDVLGRIGFTFQHQPYDHVLREDERQERAVEELVEYIARNPERKGLVPVDGFATYKFSGCLVPGYPELQPWAKDYWPRFWRCYSFLRRHGLFRVFDEHL
jgi:putative transposase